SPPAISRCINCDHRVFPARVFCPRCYSTQWELLAAHFGVVEVCTELAARSGAGTMRVLAQVRTDEGPVIIARVSAPMAIETRVALSQDGQGAMHAVAV